MPLVLPLARVAILGQPGYVPRWGVVAQWRFNGDGLDGVGINHLTAVNTPTYVAGKLGSAAQLVSASSQYYTRADNAELSTGDFDFWVAGWVSVDTVGTAMYVVAKGGGGAQASFEFDVFKASNNRLAAHVGNGSTSGVVSDSLGSAMTVGPWKFFLFWHDSVGDTINLRCDHGPINTASYASGGYDSTGELAIGSASVSHGTFWNGKLDHLVMGKRPPGGIAALADEISRVLYSGGDGRESLR